MRVAAMTGRWRRPAAPRGARRSRVALVVPSLAWWLAVHLGRFPRERLEPRHAASLTVLDADGDVLRQDATAAGGRETLGAARRASPHHLRRRDDRSRRIAGSGTTPASIRSASLRAAWLDLLRGRAAFGGSTLTMQLARSLEPHPRTLWGKVKEAVDRRPHRARAVDKREILEQYLNRVYYGNGAWGAEAAARFYFGKPAAALSLGEAAFLAVLPRGPEVYDPFRHLEAALRAAPAHPRPDAGRAGWFDAADARRSRSGRRWCSGASTRSCARRTSSSTCWRSSTPAERAGATVETTLDWPLQQRRRDRGARPPGGRRRARHLAGGRGRASATATAPCWRWSARATTSTRATRAPSTSRPSAAARARR